MKLDYIIFTYEDKAQTKQIGKPAVRKTRKGFSDYANKMFAKYYDNYQDLTVVICQLYEEFGEYAVVTTYHA